ncbi:MAG: aryl-sulfate sulfotransferase [Acidobacteriaceae bacterium]|nr:aryl-sulfate sulfotransferase [Acidobacteriaceae bacterium]
MKTILSASPCFFLFLHLAAANVTLTLTPSVNTAPVGATVTWTALASDSTNSSATFTYQFSAGTSASNLQVLRDYSSVNQFPWTESNSEGAYDIQVIAQESSGTSATTSQTFVITSRVTGSTPVVNSTAHPLVALFSAPACASGSSMQVEFRRTSSTYEWVTSPKSCNGTTSMNFYIGGMRPSTQYIIQGHVITGGSDVAGATLSYTTGPIPSGITLENYAVPTPEGTTSHPVALTSPTQGVPFATDSVGNVIWYLPAYQSTGGYLTRPVPGGTFLGTADDNSGIAGNRRLLREYDMAGNLIRETNVTAISAQLTSRFSTDPITSIHHEVFRFPNGDTGFIGSVEKIANQGSGNVDVLGDMAIVVDSNLQVKWFWNEFDNLNLLRPAVLGETCAQGNAGCPHLYQPGYSVANDWTHSNAFSPAPDGNLIISIRHQDWVVKLNYQNGAAAPDQPDIWKLGREGDFTVKSSDACPWFSHEHDTTFAANGLLTLFDNGNTRITESSEFCGNGSNQNDSRGQSWSLDETHKIATAVENLDLGAYSIATGSAELLPLGNYVFFLGFINSNNSRSVEYTPGGQLRFEEAFPQNVGYRSIRMVNLYQEF